MSKSNTNSTMSLEDLIEAIQAEDERVSGYRIAQFILFLDRQRGSDLAKKRPDLAKKWRPFAHIEGVQWRFTPPAAVLNLIDRDLVDDFRYRLLEGKQRAASRSILFAARALVRTAHQVGAVNGQIIQLERYFSSPQTHTDVYERLARVRQRINAASGQKRGELFSKKSLLIMDLIAYLGLSIPEMAVLQWGQFTDSYLQMEDGRRIQVHPALSQELLEWVESRGIGRDDLLLPDEEAHSHRLYFATRKITGAHLQCTPLELRRACGQAAYHNGMSLAEIQFLLGFHTLEQCADFLGIPMPEAKTIKIGRHLSPECETSLKA